MAGRYYSNLSFRYAFQAVLAGISTGIFTPNRVGEYAGRIMYLDPGKRLESVVFLFVDRMCQMGITVWIGTISLEYLLAFHSAVVQSLAPGTSWIWGLRLTMWLLSAAGFGLWLFPELSWRFIAWLPIRHTFLDKTRQALQLINSRFLTQILALSLMRYFIFASQYMLLLGAFGYAAGWNIAFHLVGVIFFVKSVIPSVSLTELGIRESVAIAVLGACSVAASTAFASTFILYLFNIILPALAGLIYVLRIRLT